MNDRNEDEMELSDSEVDEKETASLKEHLDEGCVGCGVFLCSLACVTGMLCCGMSRSDCFCRGNMTQIAHASQQCRWWNVVSNPLLLLAISCDRHFPRR